MIRKITDPAEAFIQYAAYSTERYPATDRKWKRHIEPLLPLMQHRRNFIIISPQFKTKEGNVIPALVQGFITLPNVMDALAEENLEEWCKHIGSSDSFLFCPYVFTPALANVPYRFITILETDSGTWLEIIYMRALAGHQNLTCDLTVKGMPDGCYAGIVNEIVYDPARKTFRQTDNKYLKAFEEAWMQIQNPEQ